MKIGIDARVLSRGTRTGVEEYASNLLLHLFLLLPHDSFFLFNASWRKPKLEKRLLDFSHVKLKDFRIPNRAAFFLSRVFNYPKVDRLLNNIDVLLQPHFLPASISSNCRKIVSVHDISFEHYHDIFSWRKNLWHKYLVNAKKQIKSANFIIADSYSTKNDLVNIYNIPSNKIKVIYPGIADKFKTEIDNKRLEEVRAKYMFPPEFVLYFGTIEPRKNLIALIKAFNFLKENGEFKSLKLVMAGTNGWLYKDILREIHNSRFRKEIILTGFIDENDKPALYKLSKLFVYPSFFEGFGFPPLEAMACGIPTIVSWASSLPEVVKDGAIMIDPYNIDEIAWVMKEALENDSLRDILKRKGIERARSFSWDKCAREVIKVIKT